MDYVKLRKYSIVTYVHETPKDMYAYLSGDDLPDTIGMYITDACM